MRQLRDAAVAAACCGVVVTWACAVSRARAEIAPKAQQLLEKVEAVLRGAEAYRCEFDLAMVMKMPGMDEGDAADNGMSGTYHIRVKQPRRWVIELQGGDMGGSSYCDGRQVTYYLPMTGAYEVHDLPADWEEQAADGADMSDMMLVGPAGLSGPLTGRGLVTTLLASAESAALGEGVTVDGAELQSIEIERPGLKIVAYVELGKAPVLRKLLFVPDLGDQVPAAAQGMEMRFEATFSNWDFEPNFAADDFKFVPPEGAAQVESLMDSFDGGESLHPLVGEPAPEFELSTPDGKAFRLADVLGQKVVMLDFWATWCGPCVQALPEVTAAAEGFAGQDVVFYAINIGEDRETIEQFLAQQELKTPVLSDPDGDVAELYSVSGIPQTVLIGQDGRVHVVHLGAGARIKDTLTDQLTRLLAGEDLAAEELAKAEESGVEPAGDPFGTEESWASDGAAASVAVDSVNGTVYGLRRGRVDLWNAGGKEVDSTALTTRNRVLRLANLVGDAKPELLTFTGWSSPLTAYDRTGKELWTYPAGQGIDDVWAADLDGDGVDEVVIGFNGGTGLHVIDAQGQLAWKNTELGNVWHVTAGKFGEDVRVISTSAAGQVHLFAADGQHIDDLSTPLYGSCVRYAPAPPGGEPRILLTGSGDDGEAAVALSVDGEIAWTTDLPGGDHVDEMKVAPDGSVAAICMRGGVVHVLDVQSGTRVAQVNAAGDTVDADWCDDDGQLVLLVADSRGVAAYELAPEP